MDNRPRFSQKHPFLFGLFLIVLAAVLFLGAAAFLRPGGGTAALFASQKLGLVRIEGMILDSAEIVDFLRELTDNTAVKGVLVRVDCPGGTIAPSQEMFRAVASLAEKKPVVASFGTVAASGGYYAVAGASFVMANPGSVTASIGVKAEYLTFEGTLEKLGIRQELLASGPLKAAGSPLRPLTPEQRRQLQGMIEDMHAQFIGDVAAARRLDPKQVAALADGRALTGRQALAVGLVDSLGGQEQAVEKLKELCGIPLTERVPVLEGPPEKASLLRKLLTAFGLDARSLARYSGWSFSYK